MVDVNNCAKAPSPYPIPPRPCNPLNQEKGEQSYVQPALHTRPLQLDIRGYPSLAEMMNTLFQESIPLCLAERREIQAGTFLGHHVACSLHRQRSFSELWSKHVDHERGQLQKQWPFLYPPFPRLPSLLYFKGSGHSEDRDPTLASPWQTKYSQEKGSLIQATWTLGLSSQLPL